MKAMRQFLIIMVLANATLAGCASNPTEHRTPLVQDVDTARMAQIEAAARRAGVEIHWVNYPLKSHSQP